MLVQVRSGGGGLTLSVVSADNQFRMSILERLEQMERRMAEMAARDNNNQQQQQQQQHQHQHGNHLATPPPPPLPEEHEQVRTLTL